MTLKEYRLTVVLGTCMVASSNAGAAAFFDWPDIDINTSPGSASFSASLFGIDVDVDVTVQQGSFHTGPLTTTHPTFLALFPSVVPVLFYQAPNSSSGADATSTLSFSSALPVGSRLLAIDLDGAAETMTLPLGLTPPVQLESMAGASSTFPDYDPLTGDLTEMVSGGNDYEVSVFDVSGLDSLAINYVGGSFNGGSFLAIALPGDGSPGNAPEPATFLLAVAALGGALARPAVWRKRRNTGGR